ncbi:ribonuclease III [Thiorhodovibrio frisius]|uniref:Ribonuclease 3 n=1 Tax=Thiorhodovibrio frisius TaxID=631362 RepID=H8Z273_9GAMM|nr:ribonuclease III [Thiorhodovibrio frisius]EIC22635.1 ribonuclease III [Thiorhodovibrio frisius]WPL22391.1 Ribonuclease 3 [Thiorhodovibrio frisius]
MNRSLALLLNHLSDRPPEHPELFEQALTHRSAGRHNNERLEFLGDALLGFVIAEALWRRFPDADEGRLTRARASLVKQESLAKQARALALGEYLRMGSGEIRTGGHARDSILSDAFEALLGAYYLDQGFDGARALILRLFDQGLEQAANSAPTKDPKTRLQESLQAAQRELPEYEVIEANGKPHQRHFVVRCLLPDTAEQTRGTGHSRRGAEQQAAEAMLSLLSGVNLKPPHD